MLLARLAMHKAKPNGQVQAPVVSADIIEFMQNVSVKDLPGVGWRNAKKMRQLGCCTCGDLQRFPLNKLQVRVPENPFTVLLSGMCCIWILGNVWHATW